MIKMQSKILRYQQMTGKTINTKTIWNFSHLSEDEYDCSKPDDVTDETKPKWKQNIRYS